MNVLCILLWLGGVIEFNSAAVWIIMQSSAMLTLVFPFQQGFFILLDAWIFLNELVLSILIIYYLGDLFFFAFIPFLTFMNYLQMTWMFGSGLWVSHKAGTLWEFCVWTSGSEVVIFREMRSWNIHEMDRRGGIWPLSFYPE